MKSLFIYITASGTLRCHCFKLVLHWAGRGGHMVWHWVFLFLPPAKLNGLDWNTGLLPNVSPPVLTDRWHQLQNLERKLLSSCESQSPGQRLESGPKELFSEMPLAGAPGSPACPLEALLCPVGRQDHWALYSRGPARRQKWTMHTYKLGSLDN